MNYTSQEEKRESGNLPTKKLTLLLKLVGLAVGLAGLIWGGMWLHYRLTHAITDAAFIEADMVTVTPLVSGHVKEVFADESHWVRKGDLLARLDDRDFKAAVAIRRSAVRQALQKREQAAVAVEKAERALELTRKEVESAIAAAKAGLRAARAQLRMAARDERRFSALLTAKAVAQRQYDAKKTALDQAREAVKAAEAALTRAEAQKDRIRLVQKELEAAQKGLKVAEAALEVNRRKLDQAKLNLAHTNIRAPQDGVVAKKFINPGDFAASGQPLFSLYDPSSLYVIANLEETRLKGVRPGQGVDVWVDALGGRKLRGRVSRLTPAAAAKFALIPRDVTAGEFTKVVQRIPVKIGLEIPEGVVLAPGMSVEIGIERER